MQLLYFKVIYLDLYMSLCSFQVNGLAFSLLNVDIKEHVIYRAHKMIIALVENPFYTSKTLKAFKKLELILSFIT